MFLMHKCRHFDFLPVRMGTVIFRMMTHLLLGMTNSLQWKERPLTTHDVSSVLTVSQKMLDVSQSIVPDLVTWQVTILGMLNCHDNVQLKSCDVLCGQWPLNWEGWSIHHVCNDFSQSSLITSQSYTGLQSKLYDAKWEVWGTFNSSVPNPTLTSKMKPSLWSLTNLILGVCIRSVCLALASQRPLNQHVWIS